MDLVMGIDFQFSSKAVNQLKSIIMPSFIHSSPSFASKFHYTVFSVNYKSILPPCGAGAWGIITLHWQQQLVDNMGRKACKS